MKEGLELTWRMVLAAVLLTFVLYLIVALVQFSCYLLERQACYFWPNGHACKEFKEAQ